MNYNTIYVGMDVHKESFTLCAYTVETDKCAYHQKTEPDYKLVLKYLEFLRTTYGDNVKFVCGYEAGFFDSKIVYLSETFTTTLQSFYKKSIYKFS